MAPADRPLGAIEHLTGRRRLLADLDRGGLGRQFDVGNDAVVAILEEIPGHVHRDHVRAHQHEANDQQCRDEPDENVGQDQLSPDAPQQPALHQRKQPPHEISERDDQADCRGAAEHFDEAGRLDDSAHDGDQDLQQGGDDEQTARPRTQKQIRGGLLRVSAWRRRRQERHARCARRRPIRKPAHAR